jgi:hypothetical protein
MCNKVASLKAVKHKFWRGNDCKQWISAASHRVKSYDELLRFGINERLPNVPPENRSINRFLAEFLRNLYGFIGSWIGMSSHSENVELINRRIRPNNFRARKSLAAQANNIRSDSMLRTT